MHFPKSHKDKQLKVHCKGRKCTSKQKDSSSFFISIFLLYYFDLSRFIVCCLVEIWHKNHQKKKRQGFLASNQQNIFILAISWTQKCFIQISSSENYIIAWCNVSQAKRLNLYQPLNSQEWSRQNFSSQYQDIIKLTSDEN